MPATRSTFPFPNKYFWRALCLTFVFGLLMVSPVDGQTDTPPLPLPATPVDGTNPSWILILGSAVTGLVVLGLEVGRRYINGRIDVGLEGERARLAMEVKQSEAQQRQEADDSQMRMQTLVADTQRDASSVQAILELAKNVGLMTQEVTRAYTAQEQQSQRAAQEREGFALIQRETTEELKRRAVEQKLQREELTRLREMMTEFSVKGDQIIEMVQEIRANIGVEPDEPPLRKLIAEGAEAAKKASEAFARVAQEGAVAPAMPRADEKTGLEADAALKLGDTATLAPAEPPPSS